MRGACVLSLLLPLVLTGCASGQMHRDLDVSGELPRVIGLGAFAPACLLFCFVQNRTTQGDVAGPDPALKSAPLVVHEHTETQVKTQTAPKKPPGAAALKGGNK